MMDMKDTFNAINRHFNTNNCTENVSPPKVRHAPSGGDRMNIGCIRITHEALAEILRLPEGHVVTAVIPPDRDEIANQTVSFLVNGATMPRHMEGQPVCIVPWSVEK